MSEELFTEVRAVIAESLAQHSLGDLFTNIDEKLSRSGPMQVVPAQMKPVVETWLQATIDAAPPKWRRLAELLGAATPDLPWLMSYANLESTPELELFRSFYSYELLAGPIFRGFAPPFLVDDAFVGFSLQAPHVFYPAHHHEPPEIYGVISGTLEWQVGDTWTTRNPGDVIVHRSHESHAMRTGDEPALTWVAWPRNPHSAVYMPSFDPADNTREPISYGRPE